MLIKNKSQKKSQQVWRVLSGVLMIALLISGCGGSTESKTYHVGLLSGVDTFNATFDGFKTQMAELGYVEGENISYDFQSAGGDSEKMAQFAQQFVTEKVDLIVTTTTGAAKAAQAATAGTDIPVLFTIIQDPVGVGLVESLRSPGGNMTGVARPPVEYLGKRVEFLKQMAPDVTSLWIIYDPDYSTAPSSVPAVQAGAASMGVKLIETQAKSVEDVKAELQRRAAMEELDIDAIQLMPDTLNSNSYEAIIDFANQHGIPVVGHTPGQVKYGALFTYADSSGASGRKAASQADQIFKGTNAGDLPVEVSDLFLDVNLKAATSLGITVPDNTLASANEIVR
jgi:putative ABC transport system substrate-binding protein